MPDKMLFRWFWAWQDDKEEKWLREMAQQGWHLQQVAFPGRYVFEQGVPRDVVYRLDFFTNPKDRANYLQIFRDAGWEYVGQYGSWQYFRKEAVGDEVPEIFTDNESKVQKYGRILVMLVILSPLWAFGIRRINTMEGLFFQVVTFIGFLLILVYIYAVLMLIRRISQLRRR